MVRPRHFTDEEILDVARACFCEQGPAVSTNVIAQAAGVSQATLFKRFGTKHDLMVKALTVSVGEELLAMLHAGPGPADLREQLVAMATALGQMFDRLLPCVMAMWAAGLAPSEMFCDPDQAPPVRARRALTAFFVQAETQGRMFPGNPEVRAMAFIGAVKELAFQKHMFRQAQPHLAPADYARELAATFWAGWAPREDA